MRKATCLERAKEGGEHYVSSNLGNPIPVDFPVNSFLTYDGVYFDLCLGGTVASTTLKIQFPKIVVESRVLDLDFILPFIGHLWSLHSTSWMLDKLITNRDPWHLKANDKQLWDNGMENNLLVESVYPACQASQAPSWRNR